MFLRFELHWKHSLRATQVAMEAHGNRSLLRKVKCFLIYSVLSFSPICTINICSSSEVSHWGNPWTRRKPNINGKSWCDRDCLFFFFLRICVLVLCVCCNKLLQTWCLKTTEFILSHFWGPDIWNKNAGRAAFLPKALGGGSVPWLSQLLAAAGIILVCASIFTVSSLGLCVSSSVSHEDTCHWVWGTWIFRMVSSWDL